MSKHPSVRLLTAAVSAALLVSACDSAEPPTLGSLGDTGAPVARTDRVTEVVDVLEQQEADVQRGEDAYHEHCWVCHLYGGSASPIGDEASAVGAVAKGRAYVIERILAGAPAVEDSPGMPSFAHLSSVEIADLVAKLEHDAALQ